MTELLQRIVKHLKDGWTPKQIGDQMINEEAKLRLRHALPDIASRNRMDQSRPPMTDLLGTCLSVLCPVPIRTS